ncbi:hypothetical protein JQ615_38675 [Bradyrhizobium jicamae]|uniref:Uncharacterized protein n=1 Tax=Bradyrhizobium jicamae TaxID=280332 RepID=A0ABS5FWR1_9BRAD|nr:hypothetical protein [Bradyrhizobium jicamae]MBR0801288.1 hypothetical protein [Bradyrhizobium jicamae]MBR0938213.1 hypothetical protein [Bradyrhizobium jicamae]
MERRWSNRANQSSGKTSSADEQLARLRVHRNNIRRYRRLLETDLTDLERRFIEKRLEEERKSLGELLEAGIAFSPPISPKQATCGAATKEHRYG